MDLTKRAYNLMMTKQLYGQFRLPSPTANIANTFCFPLYAWEALLQLPPARKSVARPTWESLPPVGYINNSLLAPLLFLHLMFFFFFTLHPQLFYSHTTATTTTTATTATTHNDQSLYCSRFLPRSVLPRWN